MPGFLKTYPDAARATEALRRTRALREHGLPTPDAEPGPDAASLIFARIEGRSGRDLIGGALPSLLPVVAALHGAHVPGLARFDPLLRIGPRLSLTQDPLLRAVAEGPVPQGQALLHGDLHVGQFLQDGAGKVWLVDLDDLALGPPEADLANFTAHLATTDAGPGITGWADRVRTDWAALGGVMDAPVFARFLQLALLRRHLKLRAAGRPDFEVEIRAYLRESASFSIR